MYQNENYSNKWFYAFITNMSYINDGMTEITITTDVFQTWQFDITWKQSFVEREMINVADDLIGANRINEGLETGEYVVKTQYPIHELEPYYIIAYIGEYFYDFDANNNPVGFWVNQKGYKYNGIYSSVTFIVCKDNGFRYIMERMKYEDNSNNILTIFTVPKFAIGDPIPPSGSGTSYTWQTLGFQVMDFDKFTTEYDLTNFMPALSNNEDFENYIPRNKKLLQYPYIYLGFNPPTGTPKVFRFEDFNDNKPGFYAYSEINPNPSVCLVPYSYRRQNKASYKNCLYDIISLSGYPTISYKTDVFNTWLAQNQEILNLSLSQEASSYQQQTANNIIGQVQDSVNTGLNLAGDISSNKNNTGNNSIIGNIKEITSAIGGAISRGVNQGFTDKNHELNVQMQMAQIEKQKMLPDTGVLSGSNSTLLGYGLNDENTFSVYCIKKEFAERIDKYFDMYGYKTNTLKIPNLNNRPNWNYIKTINANLIGNIPQNDLIAIKSFFDNGITLWHNPATYLDYSQNNR